MVSKNYPEAYDRLKTKYKFLLAKLDLLGDKLTEMKDIISKALSEVMEL